MADIHHYPIQVSFGDCDPAGIVFYPNIFRWLDATFQDFLRQFGGHKALCAELGATGMGLMEAHSRFRTPLQDGDALLVRITALDWGNRSLTLGYQGYVGDRLAFEATETRGLFVKRDGRLTAAPMQALRARLAPDA